MDHNENRDWTGLYKLGALAAIIIVLVFLIELLAVVFYGLPPSTVEGWFALLQKDRLVGLIESFALDLIAVAFHVPLYLALFVLLRQTKSYSTLILSVIFAFIGIAVYYSSNITFSMLYLSDQFASATTEIQRAQILTSGQTLLASFNGGTGPFVGYFLYAVSGILISIIMLLSNEFPKAVAVAGIVGNVLELGLPPSIEPALFLQIDPLLIGIGGFILLFWYAAIAVKFYRISFPRSV